MKIGVYCGSFNPVHNGHLTIIDKVIHSGLVDKLLVVITGNYWHKQNLPAMEQRKALFPSFSDERIIFDTIHCSMPYTYQILLALEKENPNDEFVLIIGSDNLPYLQQWSHANYIMSHEFIIIARDNDTKTFADELQFKSYHLLTIKNIDSISSTFIREHIDQYDLIKDMIPTQSYEAMLMLYNKKLNT